MLMVLWMVLQIVLRTACSRLPGGLWHSADNNSILWNLTTTFHPVLIVEIPLKSLLLLVEWLFQRCHSSWIDEVLKCGDSLIKLMSCMCIQLSVLATVPRILTNFFRLIWRFCYARIGLIPLSGKFLYHDSVPSKFTSLIEDFVISRYQVTKLLLEELLRQCVSCKRLL